MPSTLGVVASGFWSPLDLSPALWLDAADATTITEVAGAVSQWNDKSGNSNNFTQATGVSQPITGTRTQNGLNVLDFDGTNDFLTGGNILNVGTGGVTMVGVAKLDVAPTTATPDRLRALFGKGFAGGAAGRYAIFWNATTPSFSVQFQDTAGRTAASDPTTRTDTFVHGLRIVRGSALTLWRNGSIVATNSTLSGTTSYTPTHPFLVGAYAASGGTIYTESYMDGFVGELLVFLRDLTDSEMGAVNTYLTAKWGI